MSEEELNKDKQELLIIAVSTTGTRLTPYGAKHFLQIIEELEKLQKENEENIEALEEWINGERVSPHCIHKNKIRAKIEELKQGRKVKINDLDGKQKESTFIEIDKIQVLEELLEE